MDQARDGQDPGSLDQHRQASRREYGGSVLRKSGKVKMAKMFSTDFRRTPDCRFSYIQNLFNPVKKTTDAGAPILNDDGTPKLSWQVTLIFAKSVNWEVLDKMAKDTIMGQWGEQGLVRAKNGIIKTPFLDGESTQAKSKKDGSLHPGMGPRRLLHPMQR